MERLKPQLKYWLAAVIVGVIAILAWTFLTKKPPAPSASLTINTQPSGASVFLNGDPKGNSPLTINDLKKSSYTIRVDLEGYETKEEKVSLDQQSNRIEVILAVKRPPPAPLASLTINTQPSGASVFLNGDPKSSSPLTISALNTGSYTVRIELEGFESKEKQVAIGNESQMLDISLEKLKPPTTTTPRAPLPRRENIDNYLAEGKLLFQQGKYDSCIEIMNKVLQMSKNNSAAQWYIREASKRLEKSRKLSNPSAAGGTRW